MQNSPDLAHFKKKIPKYAKKCYKKCYTNNFAKKLPLGTSISHLKRIKMIIYFQVCETNAGQENFSWRCWSARLVEALSHDSPRRKMAAPSTPRRGISSPQTINSSSSSKHSPEIPAGQLYEPVRGMC